MQAGFVKRQEGLIGFMSATGELEKDVKDIVDGVIDRFPSLVKKLLEPYADKLVRSIVRVSNKFVEAKIKEDKESDMLGK